MNSIHQWLCDSFIWNLALRCSILPWVLEGIELGDNVLEVGPGPGLTTNLLLDHTVRLTTIEIDPHLARKLAHRFGNTDVSIVRGDACALPFADSTFSAVVALTMLHHIPSRELQQAMFTEVFRVLQTGGIFVGTDNTGGLAFRALHLFDNMTLLDGEAVKSQLEHSGFKAAAVDKRFGRLRFRARRKADAVTTGA